MCFYGCIKNIISYNIELCHLQKSMLARVMNRQSKGLLSLINSFNKHLILLNDNTARTLLYHFNLRHY